MAKTYRAFVRIEDYQSEQFNVCVFKAKRLKDVKAWIDENRGEFDVFVGEFDPNKHDVFKTERDTDTYSSYCTNRGMYREREQFPDNAEDIMLCLHSSTDYGGDYSGEWMEVEREVTWDIWDVALEISGNYEVPAGESYSMSHWSNRQAWINISQDVVPDFLKILELIREDQNYPIWADSRIQWFANWCAAHDKGSALYEKASRLIRPDDRVSELRAEALDERIQWQVDYRNKYEEDDVEWTVEMVHDYIFRFSNGDFGIDGIRFEQEVYEQNWLELDEMIEVINDFNSGEVDDSEA